jgi:hypothetical protein
MDSTSQTAGKSALKGVLERLALRKADEAREDLERLGRSRVGAVAGVVARVAKADDPADALCGELAAFLDAKLEEE